MKDDEIIAAIRKGNREKPIKVLYLEFPKVKGKIIATGGNEIISEEIFNDALVLLIEKVSDRKFELTSKLSTYLFGIARLLWMNELRRQNKSRELEWSDTLIVSASDIGYDFEKEERLKRIEEMMEVISDKCKEILRRFYYQSNSMQEIAEALGSSSVNSAKTQKYKCLEKAILVVKSSSPISINQ